MLFARGEDARSRPLAVLLTMIFRIVLLVVFIVATVTALHRGEVWQVVSFSGLSLATLLYIGDLIQGTRSYQRSKHTSTG